MKTFASILIILLIGFNSLHASKGEPSKTFLESLRLEYFQSVEDADKTESLIQELRALKSREPIILGYIGALQTLQAKHSWNPINKATYLHKGMDQLSAAIDMAPNDIELRFLRFTVAYYVPSILGVSSHLEEDKNKIISVIASKTYKEKDKALLSNISGFLLQTDLLDAKQQAILKKLV